MFHYGRRLMGSPLSFKIIKSKCTEYREKYIKLAKILILISDVLEYLNFDFNFKLQSLEKLKTNESYV